jgi:hypothetical protein
MHIDSGYMYGSCVHKGHFWTIFINSSKIIYKDLVEYANSLITTSKLLRNI